MVVRFDPTKLQANTTTDIGIETDPAATEKGAVSEVQMIVGEAKRHSGTMTQDGNIPSDIESEELQQINEEQEPGPEWTPEGKEQAENILSEKRNQPEGN